MTSVQVRPARPDEHDAIGELTAHAYLVDDLVPDGSDYEEALRDAPTRAGHGELLVAVDEDGGLLGTVTYVPPGSSFAEVAAPDEAGFRMLAVAPTARGQGAGRALVRACVERAERDGARRVAISTLPTMLAAHRVYRLLGFEPDPALDWEPVPGVVLLGYARALS